MLLRGTIPGSQQPQPRAPSAVTADSGTTTKELCATHAELKDPGTLGQTTWCVQVAQEVFLLSRVVRTFGSEEREAGR